MKLTSTLPLLAALLPRQADGAGEGQWFAYFHEGGLGPDRWPILQTPDNQCGGNILEEQYSQYGQSPVAVETTECSGKFDYKFRAGTCSFEDLKFSISNNGVKVEPANDCIFGQMNIPHFPDTKLPFRALQFHIHASSEHTIDGKYFPAELHIVHAQEDENGSVDTPYTVWGAMIDGGAAEDHPVFENFLRGWENVAGAKETECASKRRGLAETKGPAFMPVVDHELTSGSNGCYTKEVGETEWNPQDFRNGTDKVDLYTQLITEQYGSFTYKGGLTTPPCTQIVNWNLMDKYITLSNSQVTRLEKLIWCYVDDSCNHATAADQKGSTSRPPQPLGGRKIIHRCNVCPSGACEDVVDTVPDPTEPAPAFQKPQPKSERPNTSEGQCNKRWTEGCPVDKRANPNISPNLKANAPVWNEFEGFWVGMYTAQDREGRPLTENFVNENLTAEIPYDRSTVSMFVNRTIVETRYYEHIYYVYAPADSTRASEETGVKFCTLPYPPGSNNVRGKGKCGVNGWVGLAERFGTASFEKDGVANFFDATGRYWNASEGTAVPVADKSIHVSMRGKDVKLTETLTLINDERTRLGGTGQLYVFKNFEPYLSDPHEETFTYFLEQVSEEDFVDAIKKAYAENKVLTEDNPPAVPMTASCLDTNACPTASQWSQVDPVVRQASNPYSEDVGASAWFIAVMVILGVVVLLIVLYYLHGRQIAKQKTRIARQFARRVAETIKVEGSHTSLSAEALEEEFKRIDTDHNGYLTKSELRAFVNSGKIGTMSETDFNALFVALDVDQNGTVDFTEFCAFMAQCGNVYDEVEAKLTPEQRRQSIIKRLSSGVLNNP